MRMDYGPEPHAQDAPKPLPPQGGIQERVAQIYYKHGLMCSSHQCTFIVATLIITAICCYPLVNVPILSSSYQKFSVPLEEYVRSTQVSRSEEGAQEILGPRWFQGPPVGFVLQVVVKSAVTPWSDNLMLMDAVRSPLMQVFDVVEFISNHQAFNENSSSLVSLNDVCLQVGEPVDKLASAVLPHYGCLVVSPASIWKTDRTRFQQDGLLIKSIFGRKDATCDSTSLKEVLFGVPWRETGIKRLYVRTRQRILTYAITIVFKELDFHFLESLELFLHERYPQTSYPENVTYKWTDRSIVHLHFQHQYTWAEFIPLGVAYVMLFLYIYFSFRKMDLVKSKWALAISSVITVGMSLFMSVGLCLWFGLNLTLNGSEVLPYLVVIVGLENMLVLTKSVVSTPAHLDVKVRVAQGLSKEGWSITKNLFTELALLTFAFLTFVPIIQEFCLIAAVGVLSDFFLQLSFFATMLSFDIHRTEGEELHRESVEHVHRTPGVDLDHDHLLLRARLGTSHQRGMRPPVVLYGSNHYPSFASPSASTPILVKLPKRLRFIYFWARTRMVQKGLMVCLVVWIVLLLYKSGIVEQLADNTTNLMPAVFKEQVVNQLQSVFSWGTNVTDSAEDDAEGSPVPPVPAEEDGLGSRLVHRNLDPWEGIPSSHWMALFGYYNISLHGRYLSILPSMHVSIPVPPQSAIENRHSSENEVNLKSHWQFLSQAENDQDSDDTPHVGSDVSYHPSSPAEVALAIALSIPSILFMVYVLIVLYRCMCSRHYAEWRSSWYPRGTHARGAGGHAAAHAPENDNGHLVAESIPIKMQGHNREVEHVATDGNFVVSTCLGGDVRVWDPLTGECVSMVRRSGHDPHQQRPPYQTHRPTGSISSDSNYSSSPTSEFGDPHTSPQPVAGTNGYDFAPYLTDSLERDVQSTSVQGAASQGDVCRVGVSHLVFQPIWSMDAQGRWCVLGCGGGRMEVWDVTSGALCASYDDCPVGITAVRVIGNRIVVARMNGVLDFFHLQMAQLHRSVLKKNNNYSSTCCCVAEGQCEEGGRTDEEHISCVWLNSVRAHAQPVTVIEVSEGHVVTGSLDHLVKVFRFETTSSIYTLPAHYGGITALHIDRGTSTSAVSGCQGGIVCLWDLMTGTCILNFEAHRGAVACVLATPIYLVTCGDDSRICIWEKYQGHLLNTIPQHHSFMTSMVLLTPNVIVTANNDSLVLWDLNRTEPLKMLSLGSGNQNAHVRNLVKARRAVVADCGKCLYAIHFPAVVEKAD